MGLRGVREAGGGHGAGNTGVKGAGNKGKMDLNCFSTFFR